MGKSKVALVRYEKPYESVKKAVELSKGLQHLPTQAKVYWGRYHCQPVPWWTKFLVRSI